jgi:hypothetical protein
MILLTIEGTYKNGKVELVETPAGVEGARVLVTFLHPAQSIKPNLMTIGEQNRQKLRESVLARMEKGFHLGGSPYPRREELYERIDRY